MAGTRLAHHTGGGILDRHGRLRSLAGVLEGISRSRGWDRRMAPYRVFELWDSVCGRELRDVAAPLEIRGHTLVVAVRDQVWVNQLSFLAEDLRGRINVLVGGDFFSRIRFVVDAEKVGNRQAETAGEAAPAAGIPRPGGEELRKLDKLLASVDDEEVRDILRKVWFRIKHDDSGETGDG